MLIDRARAEAVLARHGLDFLVATRPENVYYASGHFSQNKWYVTRWTQVYALLPRDPGAPVGLVLPAGESGPVAEYLTPELPLELYGEYFLHEAAPAAALPDAVDRRFRDLALGQTRHEGPLEALGRLLERYQAHGAAIGLDEQGIEPERSAELAGRLPRARFSAGWAVWREIRRVKTPEEVRRLREAVRITEAAMEAALARAVPGVTERALHLEFEATIARMGARPNYTILSLGERGARGNLFGSGRPLRPGDLIRFDVGCVYQGYYSDIARNAVVGEPSARQRHCYDAVLAGHRAALERVRAGVRAGELFEVAMTAARKAGLPHFQRHHVGHGIGLDFYEDPLITPSADLRLEPGMVINVEIPYYEVGTGGFQVEDTVVVTDSGPEPLTAAPLELRVLG